MSEDFSLLVEIDAFLRRHDMAPTRFGRNVAKDPDLVLDMRRGRQPRESITTRARAYMARLDGEIC